MQVESNDDDSVRVSTRMYTMAIDAQAKTGGSRPLSAPWRSIGGWSTPNVWSNSGCDARAAMRVEGILDKMLE